MKYEITGNDGKVLETVEDVEFFQHVEGYIYFHGELKEDNTRDILYAVSDGAVLSIKKVD